MSKKQNTNAGFGKNGKKAKGNGTGSMGMRKHAQSGVAHNHAVSLARTREENKRLEEDARLRKIRKGKMYSSVQELFKDA